MNVYVCKTDAMFPPKWTDSVTGSAGQRVPEILAFVKGAAWTERTSPWAPVPRIRALAPHGT